MKNTIEVDRRNYKDQRRFWLSLETLFEIEEILVIFTSVLSQYCDFHKMRQSLGETPRRNGLMKISMILLQKFMITAPNAVLLGLIDLCETYGLDVVVIDEKQSQAV